MKIGLVVPHIFMHEEILPQVIFSPGRLAIDLAEGLGHLRVEVVLFSPGPVRVQAQNITADLSYFERELAIRGDSYIDLLKKHPLTFITLARQVQSELIAQAYSMANQGELDVVHIYTNEEDVALPFARFCSKPVVFTHHDPFNFLVKYKNVFPKYRDLNWVSMSFAQRRGMPADTNWVGNVYHGLNESALKPMYRPPERYIAYLGRLIEPKGVHLAIAAVRTWNKTHPDKKFSLKIAGKHYAGSKHDYWLERVAPELGGDIEYVGFIRDDDSKQQFLGNASALVVPSTFEEPFGMVLIEALACGTPIIGLDSGAIAEVVQDGETGVVVQGIRRSNGALDEMAAVRDLAAAIGRIGEVDRRACRADFEGRFTAKRMAWEHLAIYRQLAQAYAKTTK